MEKEKKMGFVYVKVGLAPISAGEFTRHYNGLIDTGATKTIIPSSIAAELGISKGQPQSVMTGNGTAILYEGEARIEIEGNRTISEVWISDKMPNVIIGVTTLELMGLSVNPKTGTLKREQFLFYAIAAPAKA